ncbi:MAG: ATP-binding protein [Rhodothermales bacterium]
MLGISETTSLSFTDMLKKYTLLVHGSEKTYPKRKLPFVRALSGETSMIDDLELRYEQRSIPLQIWAAPIYNSSGTVEYAITAFTDISDRLEIEKELTKTKDKALNALQIKSQFLANMSHEIRTPLNGIIGMTSLLEYTSLDEEQQEYVQTITASGENLLNIITDILDFSKMEAGKFSISALPLDLYQCFGDVLDLFAPKSAEKNLELVYYLAPTVPRYVRGDGTRIKQILANLISNAIKFTHQGEVVVRADACESEGGEIILNTSVSDSGIGISTKNQNLLFKSFSQVDNSTTRQYGGTGLGLSISKQLVELMQGSIEIESAPGAGTTFNFSIHLTKDVQPTQTRSTNLQNRAVLIVDDNHTSLTMLQDLLNHWKMKCYAFTSPAEALDFTKTNNQFDLAIIDIEMPEMNGIDLASKIVDTRASMPILFLDSPGSYAQKPDSSMPDSSVHNKRLLKPVHPEKLFSTLNEVLDLNQKASPV